jgi:hypothetical protein
MTRKSAESVPEGISCESWHQLAAYVVGFWGWCREGESNPQDPKVGGF